MPSGLSLRCPSSLCLASVGSPVTMPEAHPSLCCSMPITLLWLPSTCAIPGAVRTDRFSLSYGVHARTTSPTACWQCPHHLGLCTFTLQGFWAAVESGTPQLPVCHLKSYMERTHPRLPDSEGNHCHSWLRKPLKNHNTVLQNKNPEPSLNQSLANTLLPPFQQALMTPLPGWATALEVRELSPGTAAAPCGSVLGRLDDAA